MCTEEDGMRERSEKQLSLLIKIFLGAVVALLSLTTSAKFLSVFHGAKVLGMPDPVFTFLNMRQTILAAGVLECVTILLLCLPMRANTKLWFVLWACAIFWLYRVGLSYIGFNGYCPCLGTAIGWLHLSPHAIDGAMKTVLWFMTGGASSLLFTVFLGKHASRRTDATPIVSHMNSNFS
jgi:hypothetical protein